MDQFGDHPDRSYTMVLPDKTNNTYDVDDLTEMAVAAGRMGPATIIPLPMSPDELLNPPDGMDGEFFVFYMECETLDGQEHRLVFRESGVDLMLQAVRQFVTERLEQKIEREAPPEVADLMKAIKKFMDEMKNGDDG